MILVNFSLFPSPSFRIIVRILLLQQLALLVSLSPEYFFLVILKLLILLDPHFVDLLFHMIIHFGRSHDVVLLLHSLEFAGALLAENGFDGGVTLVGALRFSYLDEVVLTSVNADRVGWVDLIFWKWEGFVLSL